MSVLESLNAPEATPVIPDRARGNASIVNGKLVRVSVSQIRTFNDCAIKWGFDKIDHIPRGPPSKGVVIGVKGHGQLEHYIKTGEDVRGPVAKAGDSMLDWVRHTFPSNGGKGLVECSLAEPTLSTPGGVEFVGFVDYAAKLSGELTAIVDHKFTKSVEKYPVSALGLEDDEQAIVYGVWASLHFDTPWVEFRLNRYQYEGRKVFEDPKVRLFRDTLIDKFDALAALVDAEMGPAAGAAKAIDLKPNTAACGKYGGCDYAKICPYSPVNRWLSGFTTSPAAADPAKPEEKETNAMGLMDTLNKGAALATPAAAVIATQILNRLPAGHCKAEQEYILPGGPVGIFKAVAGANAFFVGKSDNAPRMLPFDTEVIDPTVVPAPPIEVKAAPSAPSAPIASILPPDAPASAPNAVATAQAAPTPTPDAAATPAATETAKRGPGRPKKPKDGAPTEGTAIALPEGIAVGSLILLVDCAVSKPATDLNAYVANMARELAEKSEVLDIRLAPKKTKEGHDHPLAFGGWKAMLAGIALKTVPEGLCSINSSELTEPVIEALAGVAALVVRGGR